jgi:hypothetical protein
MCSRKKASVERTLLSAAFDVAFDFDLKARETASTTVEERRLSAA